jgi:hypothetical protein
MTLDELRTLTQAKPFVPFILHIEDGETAEVLTPGSVIMPPRGDRIFVYQMHVQNREIEFIHIPRIVDVQMLISDTQKLPLSTVSA